MKKIRIDSSEEDKSTIDVISWILYMGNHQIERINNKLYLPEKGIYLSPQKLNKTSKLNAENNQKYWYRRGSIILSEIKINYFDCTNFIKLIDTDSKNIQEFYNNALGKFNHINTPNDNNINRLYVYEVANKLNIQFPNTWIGNILSECPFLLKTKNIKFLIKSLNFPYLSVRHKEYLCHLSSPSILIDENLLKSKMLPKKFFHSFFQQYIDKKYEIRTFYLKGVFKSMAIFSQQDAKTQTDFRNYDEERPNRCIPYMLPKIFEKKLHKLMQLLKINCGSIDILVTPNDEFYFLEVNPIGQFQWLSKNCNYFIEQMIAKDLVN
jgi:ATP-GRASP peptide maturase of grasp-with-spasm system